MSEISAGTKVPKGEAGAGSPEVLLGQGPNALAGLQWRPRLPVLGRLITALRAPRQENTLHVYR